MKLVRLRLSNFRSFGLGPTSIELASMTFLLGPNGAGKTAVLHALARMFSLDPAQRRIRRSDFHIPSDEAPENAPDERELWVEADFEFPELAHDNADGGDLPAVPGNFAHMQLVAENGPAQVRFRLKATIDQDDDIDESFTYVISEDADGAPVEESRVSKQDRSAIQVHYLPARRDPADHISYSTNALLGRASTRVCKTVGGSQAMGALRNRLKINADQLFWRANPRPEYTMRLIIEARFDDGDGEAERDGSTIVATVDRRDKDLAKVGLSLAESRSLLAGVQSALVSQQVASWLSANSHCRRCGSALSHKDSRSIVVRTVFGKMTLTSPRLLSCACATAPGAARRTTSPLCKALPKRVTPELEYLQVKWAAHLPFRQAADLLREVLPLDKGISFSGTRDRTHAVGQALDAEIEHEAALQPPPRASESPRQADNVSCVSVDSAWLRCCEKSETQARHVNIVAGRATFAKQAPRVYAYVHKQVASAAARLDQFLSRNGVTLEEPVSIISDDAGEFRKAVEGSQLARGKILDWFHIAMKFKAAENAVFGCKQIESLERETVKAEIRSAKWLVWHGKGAKAIARIKALDASLLPRQGYEYSTLWWNLHGITCYLRNNTPTLVNYGARYRKGLPISSSIAESAVNQVVSQRMAKKRQMRWTDAGAHHLVQVRVAVLNGELSPNRLASLGKTSNPRPRTIPSGATQALAA